MWSDFYFNDEQESRIQGLLRNGWRIREDGKMEPNQTSTGFDIPWIFIKKPPNHYCQIWSEIYFPHFHLIPSFCRTRCHKVVVKPKTVKDLYRLYDLMIALSHPSKCGMDVRDYTVGPYAAFFYCNSMVEGLETYSIVRSLVDEHLSPDTPVILKKGCTEMEAMLPTDKWDSPTEADLDLEEHLNDIFFVGKDAGGAQPDWLKIIIKRRWIKAACKIGDLTYREVSVYDPAVSAITYHNPQPAKPLKKEN